MALRYTLRQLEYFIAVGELGTITAAAQKLNVSPPSISSAINQLEIEMETQIFIRHHAQGLSLTSGGRKLFNETKVILNNLYGLKDIANDIRLHARGAISAGFMTTIAPLLSAKIHSSFVAKFPDAVITLREGNQQELLHMLKHAEIDIAISYGLELPQDVQFDPIASLPLYVMLNQTHHLAHKKVICADDLKGEAMVLLDIPFSKNYFLSCLHVIGIKPVISQKSPQLSVVRSLVANGYGFSLVNMLPKNKYSPDGKKLAFIPLDKNLPPLALGTITNKTKYLPKVIEEFIAHTRQQVKNAL